MSHMPPSPDGAALDAAPETILTQALAQVPAGLDRVALVHRLDAFLRALPEFQADPSPAPTPPAVAKSNAPLPAGTQVGPFRIVKRLGAGGMGYVYLAESCDQLHRFVALKLLHVHDAKFHALFLRECKILAGLQHAGIAHLVDAGLDAAMPWLAMEYIDGVTLDVHLERAQPDLNQRLTLVLKICEALTYAHRHMIIHRDLKPRNVMVTAEGELKLLDFGIASMLDPDTGEQDTRTAYSHLLMTPEYASPEQVNGQRLSAASDVYSLGVLFYEIVTGQRPYRLNPRFIAQTVKVINEAPITRPSSVFDLKNSASVRRARRLRGDLDTIILKALERDLLRRYASVDDLADDLRAYRRGLPIKARPATLVYRMGKFVQRRFWPVLLGAAVAVGTLAFTIQTRIQQQQLLREKVTAERVTGFLVDMYRQTDPNLAKTNDVSALDILEHGRIELLANTTIQPEVSVQLSLSLAKVYRTMGRYNEAEMLLDKALNIAAPGNDNYFMLELEMIETKQLLGKYTEAQHGLDRLSANAGAPGERRAVLLAYLQGRQYFLLGLQQKAMAAYQTAESHVGVLELDEQMRLSFASAELSAARRNHQNAVSLLTEQLKLQQKRYGQIHTYVAQTHLLLARQYIALSMFEPAREHLESAELMSKQLLGTQHPLFLEVRLEYGVFYRRMGDVQSSLLSLAALLDDMRNEFGRRHPLFVRTLRELGGIYRDLGNFQRAEALLHEALVLNPLIFGETHQDTALIMRLLASVALKECEPGRAAAFLEGARDHERKISREHHPFLDETRTSQAGIFLKLGEYALAADLFRADLRHEGISPLLRASLLNNLGLALKFQGDYVGAKEAYEQALGIALADLEGQTLCGTLMLNLGKLSHGDGRYQEALTWFDRYLKLPHLEYGDMVRGACYRGHTMIALGLSEEAYADLQFFLAETQRGDEEDVALAAALHTFLGLAALDSGRTREAERHFDLITRFMTESVQRTPVENVEVVLLTARRLVRHGDFAQADLLVTKLQDIELYRTDPYLAARIDHLAALHHLQMGSPACAVQQLERTLADWRQRARQDHPLTALLYRDLARAYAATGALGEAYKSAREARRIYQSEQLGLAHNTWDCLSLEGYLMFRLGHRETGYDLAARAHRGLSERFGGNHCLAVEAQARLQQLDALAPYPAAPPSWPALAKTVAEVSATADKPTKTEP